MSTERDIPRVPVIDDRAVQTISGRVLRKFSVYSHFYFLEITWPGVPAGSVFPVIVKESLCPPESYPRVRPGDVVRIVGRVEDHASDFSANRCFEAIRIELVEAWDHERYGMSTFVGFGEKTEKCQSIPIATSDSRIVCAVQCQLDVVDRVEHYLTLTFPDFAVSQSTSPVTVSKDRLLLLRYDSDTVDSNALAKRILADTVLMYALKRVYTIPTTASYGITISECIENLLKAQTVPSVSPRSPRSVRLHAFPRFVPIDSIVAQFDGTGIVFDPRSFTHVLTLIYADGVFLAALTGKDESTGCGLHLTQEGNPCLAVSKAAAKILEATVLLDRLEETKQRADLNGKTAIDVGASPGGWSFYLRSERKCSRVIAVDMGALAAPIPSGVEHWRMKGAEAIGQLLADPAAAGSVSCYTCDMNCELTDTVALFLNAVPLMAPESVAVLTFKRTVKNREKWAALKAKGMAMLTTCGRIDFVHEVHLIANTPNETTVLVGLRC